MTLRARLPADSPERAGFNSLPAKLPADSPGRARARSGATYHTTYAYAGTPEAGLRAKAALCSVIALGIPTRCTSSRELDALYRIRALA